MNKATKGRWQVRAAAMIIFLLGFTAGALVFNVYRGWTRTRVDRMRGGGFEQIFDNLQLTDEQKTQVHQILADTREQLQALRKESEPRFTEIRRQADERLQKVLTPEQWKQFQEERDQIRNRGWHEKRDFGPPPR